MEAEWLREGMRLALESADFTTSSEDEIGSPYYGNPRHEKLMEEVRYSKQLVLIYQAAVWVLSSCLPQFGGRENF